MVFESNINMTADLSRAVEPIVVLMEFNAGQAAQRK